MVTLANNHLKDYSEQGVIDTINFLKENNFEYVGGGKDIKSASEIKYIAIENKTVAIVNFAENEWSNADDDSAGANPLNIIDNFYQIKVASDKADFVIVIVHGGNEYYNLPSPRVQKFYRYLVDAGANLVVGHHTHCISGYELYNGSTIYYSLGNFLFTKPNNSHDWYLGAVLEIGLTHSGLDTKIHFVREEPDSYKLSLVKNEDLENVYERFKKYSLIISDSVELLNHWNIFVESKYELYLNYWSPKSFINSRILKKVLNIFKVRMFNVKGIALFMNLMRCEAHFDISKAVFTKYLKK